MITIGKTIFITKQKNNFMPQINISKLNRERFNRWAAVLDKQQAKATVLLSAGVGKKEGEMSMLVADDTPDAEMIGMLEAAINTLKAKMIKTN